MTRNRVYRTALPSPHLFPSLPFQQHYTHHRARRRSITSGQQRVAPRVAFCSRVSDDDDDDDDASYNGGRGRSAVLRNGHHRDTDEYERRASLSLSLSFSGNFFLLFLRFLALLSRSVRRFRSTTRFTPSCSRRDRARTRTLHDHRLTHTLRFNPPLVVSELASRGSRCLVHSFPQFRLSTMHASLSPPPRMRRFLSTTVHARQQTADDTRCVCFLRAQRDDDNDDYSIFSAAATKHTHTLAGGRTNTKSPPSLLATVLPPPGLCTSLPAICVHDANRESFHCFRALEK